LNYLLIVTVRGQPLDSGQGLHLTIVIAPPFRSCSIHDPRPDPRRQRGGRRSLLRPTTERSSRGGSGIVDPPRPTARTAIATAHEAGIRVRMITGDHAVTAAAIAKELGIPGKAITGAEFKAMSDAELDAAIDDVGVIARVAPEDKVRLVESLKRKSDIVAMTGDGVNDAPALKTADIGIAMGITGTEVSKEAATMILTDDNFATIVKAVELGRGLYDNLTKYIRFRWDASSASSSPSSAPASSTSSAASRSFPCRPFT
jgi:phosphoserine phosphatase